MSISINGNQSSLSIHQRLISDEKAAQKTLAHLSSGKKINSAQDNAANLAVGVQLIAQLTSSNRDVANGEDALSVADTADAALGSTSDILSRLDELAMQAGDGALSASDRADIQTEADGLGAEIDRLAGSTELNGTALLNTKGSLVYQVGTGNVAANDRIAIDTVDATSAGLGLGAVSFASPASAQSALGSIGAAIEAAASARATLGAEANRASSAVASARQTSLSLATASSSIIDADVATETSNLSSELILGQAGASLLAQANQDRRSALRLLDAA
jgi:flagellin